MTLFIGLVTDGRSLGEIIPPERRMNWKPGVTVGVPGGIPKRSEIFVNVLTTDNAAYKCAADGVTDDSPKIKAALLACPQGQVVYVPAGTYNLATTVLITGPTRNNITLRGDGMGKTILLLNGTGRFQFGTGEYPQPSTGLLPVTDGATTGKTVLTVADTATVNPGNLVTLLMDTPKWMHSMTKQTQLFKMVFKVLSKTKTTVTITPPIPIDLSRYNPQIIPWGNGKGGYLTQGIGLEGFTLDGMTRAKMPIKMAQAWGCWLKDVEIARTKSRQFFFVTVGASEVRACYTHDTQGRGPNHEGMDFVSNCCWNLIEDNIMVKGGAPPIVFGDAAQGACVGNVAAYNYADGNNSLLSTAGFTFSDSHGAGGNMLNLWEGNVGHGLHSDGYFGSSTRTTIARNYLHTTREPHGNSMAQIAVSLNHYANYFNVVGNVLGTKGDLLYYDMEEKGFGYKKLIYRLGYPNSGNNGWDTPRNREGAPNPDYGGLRTVGPTTPPDYRDSPRPIKVANALDLNVKNTLIRHGNFDFATRNADGSDRKPGIVWETDDARGTGVDFNNHNIPDSYYTTKDALIARGVEWGERAFPPIRPDDPDASTKPGVIPAWERYLKGRNP